VKEISAPGLADITVQLALNLRLEGVRSRRCARLARGSNIGPPIRIDRGMKQGLVAVAALPGFPKALARL
jgi:hypothetical protein